MTSYLALTIGMLALIVGAAVIAILIARDEKTGKITMPGEKS